MDKRISETLREAVGAYSFPAVTYDFDRGVERTYHSMNDVENKIRAGLTHSSVEAVKDALSNVLYWGYARTGYRVTRVTDFRNKVTPEQLDQALDLFHSLTRPGNKLPGLRSIAALGLPQFSGMSFVSKVRMFLDPWHFVVLDRKLLSLRTTETPTVFHEITMGPSEVMIRISRHNEQVYSSWSQQCLRLAEKYLGRTRAVDVERAIFHLIDTGRSKLAAGLLQDEQCQDLAPTT